MQGYDHEPVSPHEIWQGLTTRCFGRQIEYRESIGSTNELAKELARDGAPEGLLVIAEEQTAGKGRLGRSWSTPRHTALAMTLVLRPLLPPHHAPRLTLTAAVAIAAAVREATGLEAQIKWPNDLQLRGRKFCGILTEMTTSAERVEFLVCGMGVNVNLSSEQFPAAFRERATSLMIEAGYALDRAALVRAILIGFEQAYAELIAGDFERLLDRWRLFSCTLGQRVQALSTTGEPVLVGVAEDIDADGALLIRDETGQIRRVLAGEVSLRPR